MKKEYGIKRGNGNFIITAKEAMGLYEKIDNELFEEVIQKKLDEMGIPAENREHLFEKMKNEYTEQKRMFYDIMNGKKLDEDERCFVDDGIYGYVNAKINQEPFKPDHVEIEGEVPFVVSTLGVKEPVVTIPRGYQWPGFSVVDIVDLKDKIKADYPSNLYRISIRENETDEISDIYCTYEEESSEEPEHFRCYIDSNRYSRTEIWYNCPFEPDHLEIKDKQLFIVSKKGRREPVSIVDYKDILRAKIEKDFLVFCDPEEYSVLSAEDLFLPLKSEKSCETQYICKITLQNNEDERKVDIYCTYNAPKETDIPKKTPSEPDYLEMDENGTFYIVLADRSKKPVCILKKDEIDEFTDFMEQCRFVEPGQVLFSDDLFDVFALHTDEGVEYYALKVTEETEKRKRIFVKYHDKDLEKLCFIGGEKNSCWVDLRAAEDVVMKKGDFKMISLGVSMQLPKGYEAHVVPRSSTFKNFGIIQTNSFGVIEESYCGNEDVWKFPALAMKDTEIHKGDRICQFRIMKRQETLDFIELENLPGKSRGGFGSTGIK